MTAAQINDDIYDGYNDYPSIYSIKDFEQDEFFHETLNTSYGRRSIVSDNRSITIFTKTVYQFQ